jgi:O-antigen/teichoic acid export membrane protein
LSQEGIHQGNQFVKILKQGSWYFVSSLLTKATGFLLLPVYTRYLSPADYGILSNLTSIANIFPLLISLYLDSAFGRYYFLEKEVSAERVRILYSTLFWFISLWGAVVVAVGLLLSPFTFQPLLQLPFLPYMPLTLLPMLFGQLGQLGSIFLRSNLKAKEVSLINFAAFLCSTAITLVLLVPLRMGIQANLYGMAAAALVNFLYFAAVSVRCGILGFLFDRKVLRTCLIFSVPLIPNVAAGWITGLSDRLILAYYGKIEQAGLYSISVQIAYILYIINDAATQVQGPIGMSALTEDREAGKRQIAEFLSFFVWTILLFFLLLTFFSKEIIYIMTERSFHSAYRLVVILAFIYVMSGVYRVFTTMLSFHGKMWVISTAAIISALVSMGLNFCFIPLFGQWAAAWASFFSVMGYTTWLIVWSQRYDPIPVNYRLIAVSIGTALSLLAIQQWVDGSGLFGFWSALAIKTMLAGVYVSLLFVLESLDEVRMIVLALIRRTARGKAEPA